jgi:hypothetical protein
VLGLPSRSSQTHTTDMAQRLGIVKAPSSRLRSEIPLSDLAAMRSDAIPGRYSCVECGTVMPLQESWRTASDVTANFSTLFCSNCAVKLNSAMGLGLSPMSLTDMDKLNMGQFVPAYGVMPQQAPAPVAVESKVSQWKKILD